MTISIIGLGLIGGSMAIALKETKIAASVYGVDQDPDHCRQALELGLVDEILQLNDAVSLANLVIIAIPVDAISNLLPTVLDLVDSQVIMDVGSTKAIICREVESHSRRNRFVASHPMWGTEFSGPAAAVSGAFRNKAAVICNRDQSDEDAVNLVENIYRQLGMHVINMNAEDHDIHTAYISHVSHITSFALANTVLEKEKEDKTIFELASAGFESTVRLAKSDANMWVPIFKQNRENVLDVLNEHINQLRKFKSYLEKEDYRQLEDLIKDANIIRRILK